MKFWGWLAAVSSLLAMVAFSDIGEDLHDPGWPALEERFAAPLNSIRSPSLSWVMLHLTWLGSQPFLAALVVLVCLSAWLTPGYRDKLCLLASALTTSLLNLGLKLWFARARPGAEALPLVEEPYYSFPSGHAMISLVVYGFVAYLLWMRRPSRKLMLPFIGLVFIISTSRVYLAVHYPGDVLAGLVAGWPCLCLAIFFHQKLTKS